MNELIIYRDDEVFATVEIAEDTIYQGQFMGENKIVVNFEYASALEFMRGDYIVHKNKKWILPETRSEDKQSSRKYEYELVFEGKEYSWHNKQLMHLGVSDFTFFGTPLEIVQLFVNNINEIDAGWLIGNVDDTAEPQFFSFKDQSVAQSLSIAAEAFEMEFSFDDRTVNFNSSISSIVPGVTLSYGKNNGLYSLSRQSASDAGVATRVYGYGSTQNLPASYRGGMTRLTFEERKVDNNIDIYGIIETSITFDDIKPERTGEITATANEKAVTDSTLDFDLNNVIVQGQAKIVFVTGDLVGNEFEIVSYNHNTKTIQFNSNQEENGYIIPNSTVKPRVGDRYKLVGVAMPQTYIDDAENRVKQKTINFAEAIKHDLHTFTLNIDQKKAKEMSLDFLLRLGDKLHVVDTDMKVDALLRVQAISYPLINPSNITATISDKVTYTRSEKIRKVVAKQEDAIRQITKTSAELQRVNAVRRKEFQALVFDPDGYFDTDKIKPLSIETAHIAVGSRSQEYSLSTIFKPNFNADPNRIDWAAGVLTHFTIADAILSWNIGQGTVAGLIPATAYYIYAKCARINNTAEIVFDTEQRKVDDDASFYYFLLGVLSSVIDGIRWPTLTYGTTEINGGFIRTGRILSNDGLTWFDLNTGEFRGNFVFSSGEDVKQSVVDLGNKVDSIEIGARNLVLGSAEEKTVDNVVFWRNWALAASDLVIGETYIVSCKNYNAQGVSTLFNLSPGGNHIDEIRPALNVPFVLTTPVAYLGIANDGTGDVLTASHFKLERGNIPTDWTLALEDVSADAQAKADEAELAASILAEEAQNTANAADDKAQEVKDKTGVDSLPTGKVIIKNGMISADLITAVGAVTAGSFNLGNNKFIVNANGNLKATDAELSGKITATSGAIGFLKVTSSSLELGAVQDGGSDPWTPGMSVVGFYEDSFLYRNNGAIRGEIVELAYNLYSNNMGSSVTEAARASNTISRFKPQIPGFPDPNINIGLSVQAAGANINIGLDVMKGMTRMRGGQIAGMRKVTSSMTCDENSCIILIVGGSNVQVTLPPNPDSGRVIYISNPFGGQSYIRTGTGVIHAGGANGTGTQVLSMNYSNGFLSKFVFDDINWIAF